MARTRQALKCRGHKPDGSPCGAYAITGAQVCKAHGGRPKQTRAKAAVRAELAAWGLADTTEDPGEVLLRLVTQAARRAAEYADLLQQQYHKADSGDPTTSLPSRIAVLIGHKFALDREGTPFPVEEAIRGLVELEGQERDRCARFCKLALDAGIAERQVRLAERQGDLIADVLRAVLADPELGLTAEQQKAVPHVALRHLAVAG